MASIRKITWKEIEKNCAKVVTELIDDGKDIETIYGLPEDGLLIAVMLSKRLGKPIIVDRNLIEETTLVVDCMCDTKSDLEDFVESLYEEREIEPITAVLYTRNTSKYLPLSAELVMDKTTLVFPWAQI